jgi:DNA (cytosine-5)-methyltransferase 1
LFCGIGGFHVAASNLGMECVFACDIDADAREAYHGNFNLHPFGDITGINAKDIPDHDLLCAGFPCQPFSIIGSRQGFSDPRGTLFFEIIRIIREKKPKAVLLENVRQLASIDKGKTLASIKDSLERLGYYVDYRILNALNFGVPQKRERILIVATRKDIGAFPWPDKKIPMKPLSAILEKKPDEKHYVSAKIKRSRHELHKPKVSPSIWHENKSGNISSHPFSCALRAGASYNYLLVDGERRLTPREMLRLQGYPDSYKIICNDSQTRKQAGNSVPVPMIQSVLEKLLNVH